MKKQEQPVAKKQVTPFDLLTLNFGIAVTASIYCAARTGVAQQLRDGARDIDDLAQATGTRADALLRLMRVLSSYAIFEEVSPRRFQHSDLSFYLLPDYPGSVYHIILMRDHNYWWQTWRELTECIQTGKTAFEIAWHEDSWSRLQKDPSASKTFNEAMTGASRSVNEPIIEAYDFSDCHIIADIGGGQGSFLATLLKRNPHLKGIHFEQAHVLEDARKHLQQEGMLERCTLVAGDFFVSIPEGADVYFFKYIFHDWNYEKSLTILQTCRRAMKPGQRILLAETINRQEQYLLLMDLYMLALLDGHERTEEEFRALYQAAGFELTRIIPTSTLYSLVEGVAVD